MLRLILNFTNIMKKFLLTCMLALGLGASAQITVNESFEGTSLPSGWTSYSNATLTTTRTPSYGTNAGTACAGTKTANVNTYGTSTSQNWFLIYTSTASNATDLTYSFKYLAKGYSTTGAINGTFAVDYSVDGGTTWTNLLPSVTLNSPNATPIPCTTVSGTIPAGTIPTGANFKLKFSSSATGGDYYMGIDDVQLAQTSTSPPACTTISTPANNATGVSVTPTIFWSTAAGANAYDLAIGTTAGGTDVFPLTDVGNVTSYTLPTGNALAYSSTYYVTVYPKNALGSASGCTSNMFTTVAPPCPTVTAPAAAAAGVSLTPTFTWNAVTGATSYTISIGTTSGGTDVMNAVDVGNVTSYTYSGSPALNNSTTYYYTINTLVGTMSSASCSVRNFTTACGVLPAPYLQNFNSGSLAACWSTFSTNNTGYALWRFSGTADYGTTNLGQAGGSYVWVDASSPYTGIHDVTLQSPQIDLTGLTSPMVQFRWFKNHASTATGTTQPAYDNNSLTVMVRDVSTSTWDTIFTNDTNLLGWRTEYITLPATYLNKTIEIRFIVDKDVAGNGYFYDNVILDDVEVKNTPACLEPSGLSASAITDMTATISWIAPATAPANGYEYVYSTTNTPPTGSGTATTSTSANLTGLMPSTTYYYWVRSMCSGSVSSWVTSSFTTLATPPSNNDCTSPTALTVGGTFTQNEVTGTNVGATTTTDATATSSCQATRYNEVWYSVQVPASGNITIETKAATGSTVTDTVLGVYSGSCGALTQIGCNDDDGDGNFSILSLTGLTPGETLLVAVWNYSSTTSGQFRLSAYDASLGTSEIVTSANDVKVYPNPFVDILNISNIKDIKNVTVTDMSGRIVKTIANPSRELNLSTLKSGMYILKLDYKDGTSKTVKAVKK